MIIGASLPQRNCDVELQMMKCYFTKNPKRFHLNIQHSTCFEENVLLQFTRYIFQVQIMFIVPKKLKLKIDTDMLYEESGNKWGVLN